MGKAGRGIPKKYWGKLEASNSETPHHVYMAGPTFTVGRLKSDLNLEDLAVNDVVCERSPIQRDGKYLAVLEIKERKRGKMKEDKVGIKINGITYEGGNTRVSVCVMGGDELIFSPQHAYIFIPTSIEEEDHSASNEAWHQRILDAKHIRVSFEKFPYYLSNETRDALIASTYIYLVRNGDFKRYALNLPSALQPILLCDPEGSEIYQETLSQALAAHFDAGILILDSLLSLPQVVKRPAECGRSALVIFIKDIHKAMDGVDYDLLKRKIDNLPHNIVLIGSLVVDLHAQLDTQKKTQHNGSSSTNSLGNLAVYLQDKFRQLCKGSKESGDATEEILKLFRNLLTIQQPQDETLLSTWKQQLKHDTETRKVQSNVVLFRSALNRVGLDYPDDDTLCIVDHVLTTESVEKVIGWAIYHHFTHSPEGSIEKPKPVISKESIEFGLNILLVTETENNKFKLLKDVFSGDKFERNLLADVIPPTDVGVTFDHIGALENVKDTLKELVMLPLQWPELFSKGQLTKPCKGILLFGPPGTGKTMLAKAIATESRANFISISMSTILSKWFGDSTKYVKAIFSVASKIAPTVIFIDEVDSMLRSRDSDEHEAMRSIKNEFMLHWDGLRTREGERVIVLAATNRPFDLDEAVIRRFSRRLMVNLPDILNRGKILEIILAKEDLASDVNLKELASKSDGYSGSDLKNLCVTATYGPIREIIKKDKKENILVPRTFSNTYFWPLQMKDFTHTLKQVSASGAKKMKKILDWNDTYGEGGTGIRMTALSYFI